MPSIQSEDKTSTLVIAGYVITAVWLFVGISAFFLNSENFYLSHNPDGSYIRLEKIKLNEVGDYLAGLAAPLAFYWFFVTVFLQKEELAETRRELRRQAEAQEDQIKTQTCNHIIEAINTVSFAGAIDVQSVDGNILCTLMGIYREHNIDTHNQEFHDPVKIASFIDLDSDDGRKLGNACDQAKGEFKRALNIAEAIHENGLQKNALIKAYTGSEDWKGVLDMYPTVKAIEIALDDYSYTSPELVPYFENY